MNLDLGVESFKENDTVEVAFWLITVWKCAPCIPTEHMINNEY